MMRIYRSIITHRPPLLLTSNKEKLAAGTFRASLTKEITVSVLFMGRNKSTSFWGHDGHVMEQKLSQWIIKYVYESMPQF